MTFSQCEQAGYKSGKNYFWYSSLIPLLGYGYACSAYGQASCRKGGLHSSTYDFLFSFFQND